LDSSSWQPIETAPRDGTAILAAWNMLYKAKRWTVQPVVFLYGGWLHSWDEDEELPLEPTHWMPLPQPPNEE